MWIFCRCRSNPKTLDKPFTAVNVLLDAEIRQGIKDYSNWPTIPQLYISGELQSDFVISSVRCIKQVNCARLTNQRPIVSI